jgi:hypothetical protein
MTHEEFEEYEDTLYNEGDNEPGGLAWLGIWVRPKPPSQPYMRLTPRRDQDKGDFIFVCMSGMSDDLHSWRMDGWEYGSVIMATDLQTNPWNKKKEWRYPVHQLRSASTLEAVVDERRKLVEERERENRRDEFHSMGNA